MTRRRLLFLFALLLVLPLAAFYRGDIAPAELEAVYADGHSQFVTLLGSRIHFRDEKPGREEGPTLLLLHGTAASLHTWDGWVDHLSDDYRILRLDLQGFGLTGPNDERDYSIERQVRVLEAFLDERGVDRAAVAGNSLGGLIAWRFALAHPERTTHLVLIDAAGAPAAGSPAAGSPTGTDPKAPDESGFRLLDLAKVPVLRDVLTRLTPRFLVQSALDQVYGDPALLQSAQVDRYYRLLLREGNRRALVDAMGGRRVDSGSPRPSIADLDMPVLIQWGAEDTWIPVEHARRFAAALPQAKTIVYGDLGHVPMEEDPIRTAEDVHAFLSSSSPDNQY